MIDHATVMRLTTCSLESIRRHRRRINALNVYPVPDGDTGTNLEKTMEGIVEALARSTATTTAQLAADAQRAATMEAKGNSGVILSTIVRGLARVLGETRAGRRDDPGRARCAPGRRPRTRRSRCRWRGRC